MARRTFEVVGGGSVRNSQRGGAPDDERVARLVALGRALSDPIRVRMIGMLAEGRGCCDLPDLGVPVDAGDDSLGICVCEFEDVFGMGQSKVSYHMKKLKEAGLVHEEKRGKWGFYSLSREAVRGLIGDTAEHLGALESRGAGI